MPDNRRHRHILVTTAGTSAMAHKSSSWGFHIHVPDVVVFVTSFLAIAALAGLAAHLAPWS
jgi:hypothetical protein